MRPQKSIVQFLLSTDLPESYFNAKNVYGYTPFIIACQHGHAKVVQALLSKDFIEVNEVDINGIPGTLWACLRKQNEVMNMLENQPEFKPQMATF